MILIVAHDAGGANNIAGWLRKNSQQPCRFLLEGPALKVFEEFKPQVEGREVLQGDLKGIECILTGTGWKTDLEKSAIASGKKRGVRVISFLDHWSNYRKRFEFQGSYAFPDEIWLGDDFALEMAKVLLPEIPVKKLVPNYYVEEIISQIHRLQKSNRRATEKVRVLYLAQPISDAALELTGDRRGYGYLETEALEMYLKYLEPRMSRVEEFRLRHHPAESAGKYETFLRPFEDKMNVTYSSNTNLAEDCAWADWIVGCDTMAMAIAAQAQKEVYCCIPPGGNRMVIPERGIQVLFKA